MKPILSFSYSLILLSCVLLPASGIAAAPEPPPTDVLQIDHAKVDAAFADSIFLAVWDNLYGSKTGKKFESFEPSTGDYSSEWNDHRDCHIRPDLVLIYRKPDKDHLDLVRLGSHSELGW